MTAARTVTEEYPRQRAAAAPRPAAPAFPPPTHPLPPIAVTVRDRPGSAGAPTLTQPAYDPPPAEAATPARHRRPPTAADRRRRRLAVEKVLAVCALVVLLAVTLLLLGLQWLASSTPTSSGPVGLVSSTHPAVSEGGP